MTLLIVFFLLDLYFLVRAPSIPICRLCRQTEKIVFIGHQFCIPNKRGFEEGIQTDFPFTILLESNSQEIHLMYQLICISISISCEDEPAWRVILAEKIKHGADDNASIIHISQTTSSSLNCVFPYRKILVLLALLEGLQRCLVLC